MLVPKHAKKAHKRTNAVSSEKLALKARRREEQAPRERAKAAEYAAERGQLPPPDVHDKAGVLRRRRAAAAGRGRPAVALRDGP